jgi:hypothetical protein
VLAPFWGSVALVLLIIIAVLILAFFANVADHVSKKT